MGKNKNVKRLLSKDIIKTPDIYKRKVLKFMDEHGVEVTVNMLDIPKSTLYLWKKSYSRPSKQIIIKGKKHERK